ncbi:MAG: nucleoside hydrolase [Eubacteriales bacterium]|nr:nucleoside hydrolase [Eubacteriales bacterium]
MKPAPFAAMFPRPDYAELVARLERPTGPVDVILDTDTYNEIDDQFALAYLVRSEPQLRVKAITAAPFYRDPAVGVCRSRDAADGMEKSYDEILRVLDLLERPDLRDRVYHGARTYLPSETQPVPSDAAAAMVRLSKDYDKTRPLYIVAIGAITNVASALLTDPTMVERCVVIWLGGHAHHWGDCTDFNVSQDIAAARVVFGCGVPLVQFPCLGVVSEFRFSRPELEYWFRGKNKLCDRLIDDTYDFARLKFDHEGWSKPLWDAATIVWLLQGDFLLERYAPSPIPQYDCSYAFDDSRHPIKYVYYVKKDAIIADLAEKLGR